MTPPQNNEINLVYIRAAIEEATGKCLKLKDVRRYLLEEGLITPAQARKEASIFRGYSEFYDFNVTETKKEDNPEKELNFQDDEPIQI